MAQTLLARAVPFYGVALQVAVMMVGCFAFLPCRSLLTFCPLIDDSGDVTFKDDFDTEVDADYENLGDIYF